MGCHSQEVIKQVIELMRLANQMTIRTEGA